MILLLMVEYRYFLSPWYTPPRDEDSSMRLLCRGWTCGSENIYINQNQKLAQIISMYRNETIDTLYIPLKEMDSSYIPLICAKSHFYLFGFGGFPVNVRKSYDLAFQGRNFWVCKEILAFHPLTPNKSRATYTKYASDAGSVRAMKKVATDSQNSNVTHSIELMYHLLVSSTSGWYQKHRGGIDFAQIIRSILLPKSNDIDKSYQMLIDLAKTYHVPAVVWLTHGYLTGKTKIVETQDLFNILSSFMKTGPWQHDVTDVYKSSDEFNRSLVLEYLSNSGDQTAQALFSYPDLYEEF